MNKKTILYITSSKLANIMNNERWHLVEAFKRAGHAVIDVENDNLYGLDLPTLIKNQKFLPDLIIFEEMSWSIKLKFPLLFKNCHKVPIPKATFISDYWIYTNDFRKLILNNCIKTLFTCHEGSYPFIGRYFGTIIDHLLWVPLTIDLKEFNFPSQKKKYDFFLSGALTNITPFRGRVIDIVENNFSKNQVFRLEHPGHWKKGENLGIRGKEYYKLLSQSYFCLCTCGIYNISSRKYWEICAAGSTVFGNQTNMPELILIKNNLVEINEQMTDKAIVAVLNSALANKKFWQKQAEIAQKNVKDNISTDQTVQRIENEINKISMPPIRAESRIDTIKKRAHQFIYYNLTKHAVDKV